MEYENKLRILEKANELIKIRVWAVAQVADRLPCHPKVTTKPLG